MNHLTHTHIQRERHKHLVTLALLFQKKAHGGSELSADQGTEDEMGADVASVMDRGRHPWFTNDAQIKDNSRRSSKKN